MKRLWQGLVVITAIAFATCVLQGIAGAQITRTTAATKTAGPSLSGQPGSTADMQLISPEDLVKVLQAPKSEKPLILNIGPRVLYMQAHIPGAEFIGPASEHQALDALRARVKSLPKSKYIVIYCGCCPWSHCPNVQPAYKALTDMGFKKVNALYIAGNFGSDWVYKGYPTARGQ